MRNITKSLRLALILGLGLSTTISATPAYDYARVIRVTPDYRTVEVLHPKEVCYDKEVYHQGRSRHTSHTIPIIGAILGGVLGNKIGHHKDSKRVGAVAGALLGSSIGRDVRDGHDHGYTTVQRRCYYQDVVHTKERIDGYQVTYRYLNRTYTTHTRNDPGSELRVRVDVRPAEY